MNWYKIRNHHFNIGLFSFLTEFKKYWTEQVGGKISGKFVHFGIVFKTSGLLGFGSVFNVFAMLMAVYNSKDISKEKDFKGCTEEITIKYRIHEIEGLWF
jgi:hypothetical protein